MIISLISWESSGISFNRSRKCLGQTSIKSKIDNLFLYQVQTIRFFFLEILTLNARAHVFLLLLKLEQSENTGNGHKIKDAAKRWREWSTVYAAWFPGGGIRYKRHSSEGDGKHAHQISLALCLRTN